MSGDTQDRSAQENQDQTSASTNRKEFEALASAAKSRINKRSHVERAVESPGAMADLAISLRPVNRFLAGRNATPEAMRAVHWRIGQTRRMLVEAGMAPQYRDVPVDEFPWHCVDEKTASRFRELVDAKYPSLRTRVAIIGTPRMIIRLCVDAGLMPRRTCERLLICLEIPQGVLQSAGREIEVDDVMGLLRSAGGSSPIDVRDRAMFVVLLSTGMRVSELVALDLADWHESERLLVVRRSKGGHSYDTWLSEPAVVILSCWLELRGSAPGPLFDGVRRPGRRLATITVRDRLTALAKRSEIEHCTPHNFRHTFITRALRAGIDPLTVMRLVGHRSISTTLLYDQRTSLEDRDALHSLEFPELESGGEESAP